MSQKKYKKDFNYSYTYGVYPTIELLEHKPEAVIRILLHPKGKQNEGMQKIKDICKEKNIPTEISPQAIYKITNAENMYTLGIFKKFDSPIQENENHVVLVNPTDPGNLGTIIRAMQGFDLQNLAIIKPGVDMFDPKVIRASMGSVFSTNISYFGNFQAYASRSKNTLYPIMTNGKTKLENTQFKKPFSLIFGSEGAGLPKEFEQIGESLSIPQSDKIDSLNLSIAAGIVFYETYTLK